MKKVLFALPTLLASGAAMSQGCVGVAGGATKQDVDCAGLTKSEFGDETSNASLLSIGLSFAF